MFDIYANICSHFPSIYYKRIVIKNILTFLESFYKGQSGPIIYKNMIPWCHLYKIKMYPPLCLYKWTKQKKSEK